MDIDKEARGRSPCLPASPHPTPLPTCLLVRAQDYNPGHQNTVTLNENDQTIFFLSKSNSNLIDWFGNEGCIHHEVLQKTFFIISISLVCNNVNKAHARMWEYSTDSAMKMIQIHMSMFFKNMHKGT